VDPEARFTALVQGDEAALSLDEASLLMAATIDPATDIAGALAALDGLATRFDGSTFDELRRHLFATEGFRGDEDNYYDADNSFLDRVISRRCGIPITLAVVTMEVGRRVGIAVDGIGMPGHFLVHHGGIICDPFHGGRVLDVDGCAAIYAALAGSGSGFDPSMLAPVGPLAILTRMLANLKRIYTSDGNLDALERVLRLRTAMPDAPDEDHHQLTRLKARWN
jgi:regulator of sirC expression with transglutaminase-like and TPR domain